MTPLCYWNVGPYLHFKVVCGTALHSETHTTHGDKALKTGVHYEHDATRKATAHLHSIILLTVPQAQLATFVLFAQHFSLCRAQQVVHR